MTKRDFLDHLASVKLTLVCLGLSMGLVLIGTLAQVRMGTFAAQKEFFNSWWLPYFPGGLTIGTLWMVNLVAAFITRFNFRARDAGVLMSHFGIILLMAGQFLTQTLARESNMPIEIGQTLNYSQDFRNVELAFVMTSNLEVDHVTSIPPSLFSRIDKRIDTPSLPFSILIKKFYPNARLGMVGTRITAEEIPPVLSDDEVNTVAAYVEIYPNRGREPLGTWLVSSGLGAPQSFSVQDKEYHISIRPKRHYYPFSLTLKEFHHDLYAGTDIPKNFSSLVHLKNSGTQESRDVLIYMNHPLRYEGKTFYQASFGKGNRLSVFQVVNNPAAWTPYVSCGLVVLGLLIQFLSHLLEFIRKRT